MAIETFYHWGFFSWDFGFSTHFRSLRCMKEFGDGFGCVIVPRLLTSWRKLQLSPLENCPLDSHRQQSPRILSPFCPLILDHGVSFIISIPGAKILISYILLDTSFHHRFQSVIIWSYLFSSDESPGHTIPIRSCVSQTLVFLICTIPSKMSSGGICVIDNKIPTHFESNS